MERTRSMSDASDPLPEALAHGLQVLGERLAVAFRAECGEQVRRRADDPIPDVEDRLDLVFDHAV